MYKVICDELSIPKISTCPRQRGLRLRGAYFANASLLS